MSCVYLRSLRQAHMCLSGLSLLVYQNKMRSICYFLLCVCGVHLCVPISTSRFCSAVFPGVFILLWFPPVYILCPPRPCSFFMSSLVVCAAHPPPPCYCFCFCLYCLFCHNKHNKLCNFETSLSTPASGSTPCVSVGTCNCGLRCREIKRLDLEFNPSVESYICVHALFSTHPVPC